MKKRIIIGAVIVLGIAGLMLLGRSNTAPQTSAGQSASSQLTPSETLYDFGTISMANGKVDHLFRITNPTAKSVTLQSISTSCMCTTAYLVEGNSKTGPFGMAGMGYVSNAGEAIPPRGTKDIDVVYDPNAHGPAGVGNIDRFVSVTDANGGMLQLEIKAVVTP